MRRASPWVLAASVLVLAVGLTRVGRAEAEAVETKHVLGAIEVFTDRTTGMTLKARIDTGATTCSLHAEDIVIEGASRRMSSNIGKTIRFRTRDAAGRPYWVESRIAGVVRVRTSEGSDRRYKIPMDLSWGGLHKRVLVTVNDRSMMTYPLLIGRNYLRGDFVVDVARNSDD